MFSASEATTKQAILLPALAALVTLTPATLAQDHSDSGFQSARTVNAQVRLSHDYLEQGRWRQAAVFAGRATEAGLFPGHRAAALTNECIALSQLGQHDAAIASCEDAVELRPNEAIYQANLETARLRAEVRFAEVASDQE
jgi:Tfp pilus assembly protein PilF